MKLVAIAIPVYKSSPSDYEKISFEQCIRVLGKHPFIFFAPSNLDLSFYTNLCKGRVDFSVQHFDSLYFRGIEGYNRLLLQKEFYQRFGQYRYILIHQLDVFIFRDDLEKWCDKGYDYAGAPWVNGRREDGSIKLEESGGNGGLSLRKVHAHVRVLDKYRIMQSLREIVSYFRKFHEGAALYLRFPLMLMRWMGYKNNSKYFVRQFAQNEDVFWSSHAARIDSSFRIAPAGEEISFAFEKFPRELYKLNNEKLPFGCHAWEKHDIEFWKPHIKAFGYDL